MRRDEVDMKAGAIPGWFERSRIATGEIPAKVDRLLDARPRLEPDERRAYRRWKQGEKAGLNLWPVVFGLSAAVSLAGLLWKVVAR